MQLVLELVSSAPKTIEDVEKLLADSHHHEVKPHSEKVAPHAAEHML